MLTYIDKYDYKYKNKMSFTRGEKYFFTHDEIRKILRELNKKKIIIIKKATIKVTFLSGYCANTGLIH